MLPRQLQKGPVALVDEEEVGVEAVVGHVDIEVAVLVKVCPGDPATALDRGGAQATLFARVGEGAVAVVVPEEIGRAQGQRVPGLLIVGDVEIDEAVAVVVPPGGGLGWIVVVGRPSRIRDVRERPVALVAPKMIVALRVLALKGADRGV